MEDYLYVFNQVINKRIKYFFAIQFFLNNYFTICTLYICSFFFFYKNKLISYNQSLNFIRLKVIDNVLYIYFVDIYICLQFLSKLLILVYSTLRRIMIDKQTFVSFNRHTLSTIITWIFSILSIIRYCQYPRGWDVGAV